MSKRVFLCLTDLHFSDETSNFTDDAKELGKAYGGAFRTSSFASLKALLEFGFEPNELDFAAVVGDITTRGSKDGLDDFCTQVVPRLERIVPEKAICIVPGNHDVAWGLDPNEPGYFDKKFRSFTEMIDEARATTCLLPTGEIDPGPDSTIAFRRPSQGPLYVDHDKQLLVLNINSAMRCGELHKEMYGDFMGWMDTPVDPISKSSPVSHYFLRDIAQFTQYQAEQLQSMMKREKKRAGDAWNSYLKIALVHHHVVHFPGQTTEHKGYEFMLDSSLLLEFLTGFDFDLILTGHKHHAYEMIHRFKNKEIFIVGGSTVGGHESPGSFRGIRLIEFDSDHSVKRLKIKNITEDLSQSDVRDAIEKITPISLQLSLTPAEVLKRAVQREGFSYGEIVATTKITENGDAIRTVQCDELAIRRSCERAEQHTVSLPPTSGYIDHFMASSSDIGIGTADLGTPSFTPKSATMRLRFRPKLSLNSPVAYQYQWTAVNAFALDKRQFKRMYPDASTALPNIEFTHFQPRDPTETMTLMVQLPVGFKFTEPPHLRVARPDPNVSSSRLWQLDEDATQALRAARAMRFIPALNTIELRVSTPDPNLSYGVEWKLPEGPVRRKAKDIPRLIRQLERKGPLSPKILYKTLSGVRRILLGGWDGHFDMNLMVFGFSEYPGMLKSISAGRFTQLVDGSEPKAMEAMSTDVTIPYGLGIAGRALKANRPQFHVSPEGVSDTTDQDNLNFYLRFEGSLDEKKLVCIPLHLPVSDKEFGKKPNIYATCEPYGILNIGSEDENCPMSPEFVSDEETEAELKSLQHHLSKAIAQELFGESAAVQNSPKSVDMD